MEPSELLADLCDLLGLPRRELSAESPLVIRADDAVEMTLAPLGGAVQIMTRLCPSDPVRRPFLDGVLELNASAGPRAPEFLALEPGTGDLLLVLRAEGLASAAEAIGRLDYFLSRMEFWQASAERLAGIPEGRAARREQEIAPDAARGPFSPGVLGGPAGPNPFPPDYSSGFPAGELLYV